MIKNATLTAGHLSSSHSKRGVHGDPHSYGCQPQGTVSKDWYDVCSFQ